MSLITSFLLEPAAYFIFAAFTFLHSRSDKRTKAKVLYLYYFITTVLMVRAAILGANGKSNIEIYSLLCLLTSIGMGIYFHHTLLLTWKKWLVILLCVFNAVYYVSNNVMQTREVVFDSVGHAVLSVSIIIMTFLYLHQVLSNVTEEMLSMNFDFWFVCSQLIYHLSAFFIFLTFNYLTKKILPEETYSVENRMLLTNLWRVHNILLMATAVVNATGVIWIAFHRKSPSSS